MGGVGLRHVSPKASCAAAAVKERVLRCLGHVMSHLSILELVSSSYNGPNAVDA